MITSESPYGALVGTRILNVDPAGETIEVEYQAHEGFTNRIGTVAGAMIAGLLDSVTGLIANAGLAESEVAVHTSLSVQYHRPATPGTLTGRGRRVERSARDIRSRGELFDVDGYKVASATATLRIIANPSD